MYCNWEKQCYVYFSIFQQCTADLCAKCTRIGTYLTVSFNKMPVLHLSSSSSLQEDVGNYIHSYPSYICTMTLCNLDRIFISWQLTQSTLLSLAPQGPYAIFNGTYIMAIETDNLHLPLLFCFYKNMSFKSLKLLIVSSVWHPWQYCEAPNIQNSASIYTFVAVWTPLWQAWALCCQISSTVFAMYVNPSLSMTVFLVVSTLNVTARIKRT